MKQRFTLSKSNKIYFGIIAVLFIVSFIAFSEKTSHQIGEVIGKVMFLLLLSSLFAWIVWRVCGRKQKGGNSTFNIILTMVMISQIGQFASKLQQSEQLSEIQERKEESQGGTVAYSVGEIALSVPMIWKQGKTNTPLTKLFLFIPDGKGGANGVIKVDVGRPIASDLAANVEAMESRFGGKSTQILDGSVILTTTTSTSVNVPRHIFTTMAQGKVYFVFVAADNPGVADEACQSIGKTLKMPLDRPDAGVGK